MENLIEKIDLTGETDPFHVPDEAEQAEAANQAALQENSNPTLVTPQAPAPIGIVATDPLAPKQNVIHVPPSEWKPQGGTTQYYKGNGFGGGTYQGNMWHGHVPTKVIQGKGWEVWAGSRTSCASHIKKFPLIMNLTRVTVAPNHVIPVPELKRWETFMKTTEIMLDWPDQESPSLPVEFWIDLQQYLAKTKGKLLIFCLGGHGRTGTAIASLLIVSGWTADRAQKWIRKNYCGEAIETIEQEEYLAELEEAFLRKQGKEKKAPKADAATTK